MTVARASFVLFCTLVLQTTLFARLVVVGVHPDVVVLFAIVAGIVAGPERGAIAGFAAGLGLDLLVVGSPIGLYALAYCITGYAVGSLQGSVLRAARWIPVVSAFWASAMGVVAFAVIGTVLGQVGIVNGHLLLVAAVVAAANAVLVAPALRVSRWIVPERRSRLALG